LFGSATLGGAVNYILNPVSLTDYTVRAQMSGSRTQGSSDTGYSVKAAANLPLIQDTFGVRLTLLKRFEPGYLDNIGIGQMDMNSHDVAGARINALWQINEKLKLEFFSFYDRARNGDDFYAFPALGDLVRNTIVQERRTFDTRVNNLKLDANLDFASLTVSLADSRKTADWVGDFSSYYGAPTIGPSFPRTHSRMIEARLTSPGNQKVDWLAGIYSGWFDELYPSPTLQNNVDIYDFTVGYRSNETSGFGEATYHFSEKWRATLGGRYYDIRLRTETDQGIPGTVSAALGHQTGTGLSPKASVTFEPNTNVMTYALVSKGFRMGGVNLVPAIASFPTPATYQSDSLINYELGLRLSSVDRRLTLDSTVFHIDWSDVQLQLHRPDGFAYVSNAGRSRSNGVETALTWRPANNLEFSANVTYLDARLTDSLALGNGTTLLNGTALPGASKWSSSEVASYRFAAPWAPFITLTHRYVSGANSAFLRELPIGNYHLVDVRSGIDVAGISAAIFASNLTNRRGVTSASFFGITNQVTDYYVRPRTIGLQLEYGF
jgi:outer membrane receptor protein involved in Fe transport